MSNDLISREALIETISKITFYSVHNGEFIEGAGLKDTAYYRERDIYRAIIEAPTIEERPKGKWIPAVIDTGLYVQSVCREWKCSNCGEVVDIKYPFCHCGADMRGDV